MRVRREKRVAVLIGDDDKNSAQSNYCIEQRQYELSKSHAIHRHVDVVSASRGMQNAGHIGPASGGHEVLDVEEEILTGPVVSGGSNHREIKPVERRVERTSVRA